MSVRGFGKFLGRVLLALLLLYSSAWLFAPREPVDWNISFRENALPRDLDAYLAAAESQYSDIVPGTEKRIVWADTPGTRTELSVVYLHGFSATSEEIRPVPDLVAQALGANLFYTRLAGHGRGGPAMAEPVAGDWLEDAAEALGIGRRIGREVLVIATSTGGTLAAIAATDASQIDAVKGIAFVSPNFRVRDPAGPILTMPFARWWGPALAGDEIMLPQRGEAHAQFWTTRYPSVAALPMGALVRFARGLDYSWVTTPALFVYSDDDQIVSPRATRAIAERWGGEMKAVAMTLPPGNDNFSHILAGDILSPDGTAPLVAAILEWEAGL